MSREDMCLPRTRRCAGRYCASDSFVRCFEDARLGFIGGRILLHDSGDYPQKTITIQEKRPTIFLPAIFFLLA